MLNNFLKLISLSTLLGTTISCLVVSGVLATFRTFKFFLSFERKPNSFGDIVSLPFQSWSGILMVFLLSIIFICFFFIIFLRLYKKKERNADELGDRFSLPKETPYGKSKFSTVKELEYNDDFEISDSYSLSKGIILGKLNNKVVGINPGIQANYNTVLFGTSGGGKTQSFILPNTLNCIKRGDSFVVIDPKGEIFSNTQEYLSDYNLKVINIKNPTCSNGFDLLSYINFKREEVYELTNNLFNILQEAVNDYFFNEGGKFVVAFIIAISMEFKELRKTHPEIEEYSVNGYKVGTLGYGYDLLLEYPGKKSVREHLDSLYDSISRYDTESEMFWRMFDPGDRADLEESFLANAKNVLSNFFDKDLLKIFSTDDFKINSLLTEKTALFITMNENSTSRKNKLASVILNTIIKRIESLKDNDTERDLYPQKVFFILDEFGAIGTIQGFTQIISGCRSRDMVMLLSVQDVNQLEANYGNSCNTILNNCNVTLATSVKDEATSNYLSNLFGDTTKEVKSKQYKNKETIESVNYQPGKLMERSEIANLVHKNIGKFKSNNLLLDQMLFYEEEMPLNKMTIEEYFKIKELQKKKLEERRVFEEYE